MDLLDVVGPACVYALAPGLHGDAFVVHLQPRISGPSSSGHHVAHYHGTPIMISQKTTTYVFDGIETMEDRLDTFERTVKVPQQEVERISEECTAMHAALDDLYLLTLHLSEGRATKADITAFLARHTEIIGGAVLQ